MHRMHCPIILTHTILLRILSHPDFHSLSPAHLRPRSPAFARSSLSHSLSIQLARVPCPLSLPPSPHPSFSPPPPLPPSLPLQGKERRTGHLLLCMLARSVISSPSLPCLCVCVCVQQALVVVHVCVCVCACVSVRECLFMSFMSLSH